MNGPMNGQAAGTVSCRRDDLLIERIDRIGSTSTALLERPALVDDEAAAALAAAGQPVAGIGAVWLVALHQTGGRGRRGRAWRSDPQASLAASLAIEAALPAEPGALTLVAGATVALPSADMKRSETSSNSMAGAVPGDARRPCRAVTWAVVGKAWSVMLINRLICPPRRRWCRSWPG